ncbi:AraC family transcriptional regulator [Streptomyces beijiangensis]|uniref:AraC family transcriptional regulator n=1 Tax=Streptomyces beijiangensis TaxID=163361 RepID=A0A939F7P6_9ACTN|nr:AraC family transcriptional regulator [Streptomyces beijiangensis]MBO0513204.1 AraC family transcriptional regulator [Streptomyces beijiangensis]
MDVVSDAVAAVRIGRPSSNRVRVSGSWCARLAPYDGAGFHVVREGGCWLLPDGGGSPISLGVGDAVLLPHGTGHVIADAPADATTVERAVPFDGWLDARVPGPPRADAAGAVELLCGKYRLDRSRVHPLMAELPEVVHLPNRVGTHPELRTAVDLLGHELATQGPGSCIAVPSLVDLLLVYMIRSWVTQGTTGAWPTVLGDPVAAAALRALHSDPAAPWTIDRLAAEAGVSRPTLARRFTALVGRPPMAYLTWWRLISAATLLRDTPDPLAAIARRVGYGSPYALSHAFSRQFGTTPGQYRAAATEQSETRGQPRSPKLQASMSR